MSKELEVDFERLGAELKDAQEERKKMELGYDEITSFLDYSKTLMEHPTEMFLNVETYSEQMATYQLLFLEFPTYKEIVSGTPKISLFFKVSSENNSDKSLDVTLRGIEAYSFGTGFAFSPLLRFTSKCRKYAQPFRFPDAKRAGALLRVTFFTHFVRSKLVTLRGIEPRFKA